MNQAKKQEEATVANSIDECWNTECSSAATHCKNYIRDIVDTLDLQPNPAKDVIALSIGDPTLYGNLRPAKETLEALIEAVHSNRYNGYAACVGYQQSREAVANYLNHDGAEFTSEDIVLCSGCSSSLEICITALCDEKKNHNMLVPRPGFPLYRTLAETIGIKVKYYDLISEQNWEVNLEHLQSQIDAYTAVIVLNNPSNPCGSVYSKEHLKDILQVAQSHKIPIIADEIYEQIVFTGSKFISTASISLNVPILVCGGLAKRFLVPGWRLGWIAIHDRPNAFKAHIRKALLSLSQRIIGSNTLVQGTLPEILVNTPQSFFDNLLNTLENNAKLVYGYLKKEKGLVPYMPQGTMYMMIKIHSEQFGFGDILQFVIKLMEEESVFCLPGSCFEAPEYIRVVLTVPEDLMQEACNRMVEFCKRYYVATV